MSNLAGSSYILYFARLTNFVLHSFILMLDAKKTIKIVKSFAKPKKGIKNN